jgi:DNA primase
MYLKHAKRGFISPELIEYIRSLAKIEEIVGETVRLRPAGRQFRGRCPFHKERMPSFQIDVIKQVFYCHGCKVGGDVFQFVRLHQRCSFRQSVEFLAARSGMRLEGFRPSPTLSAEVAAIKGRRERKKEFDDFSNQRIKEVNEKYRALSRAATNAEMCLLTGKLDSYEEEMAWSALERYRAFENHVEREGLTDPTVLRAEWDMAHGV